MHPDRRNSVATATLRCLIVIAVSVSMLSCITTRGRWSDGWYSERITLHGQTGNQQLQLRYQPGPLGADWQRGDSATADVVFRSGRSKATIYSDSSCGSRYEDAPLGVLLNHLLFGFTDVKLSDELDQQIGGRAALTRQLTARLDGAPVEVAATVTKNGPCVFDLVFIGAPGSLPDRLTAYERFVGGLIVEYDP